MYKLFSIYVNFSGFNTHKIIKIGYCLTELFEKEKGGRFGDTVYIMVCRHTSVASNC